MAPAPRPCRAVGRRTSSLNPERGAGPATSAVSEYRPAAPRSFSGQPGSTATGSVPPNLSTAVGSGSRSAGLSATSMSTWGGASSRWTATSTDLPVGSIDWSAPPALAPARTRSCRTFDSRSVETCHCGLTVSLPTTAAPRRPHSRASVNSVSPCGSAKACSRAPEDSRIGVAATSPPLLSPGFQAPVTLSNRLTISGCWRQASENQTWWSAWPDSHIEPWQPITSIAPNSRSPSSAGREVLEQEDRAAAAQLDAVPGQEDEGPVGGVLGAGVLEGGELLAHASRASRARVARPAGRRRPGAAPRPSTGDSSTRTSLSGASGKWCSFSSQATTSEADRAALLRFAMPSCSPGVRHLRTVEERVVADSHDEGVRDRGCGHTLHLDQHPCRPPVRPAPSIVGTIRSPREWPRRTMCAPG